MYLSTMLQNSVFHNITKHLNGTAKAKDAKSSAHIKSLTFISSSKYNVYSLIIDGNHTTFLHLLLQCQKVHPSTGLDLGSCSHTLEIVEIYETSLVFLASSA